MRRTSSKTPRLISCSSPFHFLADSLTRTYTYISLLNVHGVRILYNNMLLSRIYVHTTVHAHSPPTRVLGIMAVKADESFFPISSTLIRFRGRGKSGLPTSQNKSVLATTSNPSNSSVHFLSNHGHAFLFYALVRLSASMLLPVLRIVFCTTPDLYNARHANTVWERFIQ